MIKMLIAGLTVVVLLAIDIATKLLALDKLKPMGNITWIPGFMDFTFVENRGAAFGILNGQRWFFIVLTILILCGILYYYNKLPQTRPYLWLRFALLLMVSGALGNLLDRAFRGYVVDFLEFTFISFPVFNMADIYVVCGTAIMVFLILFVMKDEPIQKTEKNEDKPLQ